MLHHQCHWNQMSVGSPKKKIQNYNNYYHHNSMSFPISDDGKGYTGFPFTCTCIKYN